MKINFIDLFAGCGGLTDGFLQTKKFSSVACVDWEQYPLATLKNRLKNKWGYKDENKFIHFDLQRTDELLNGFDDDKYQTSIGLNKILKNKNIDLIIGGPPCQAYSIAGRVRDKDGMKNDYRNYLFESYVKIVKQFKPKAFIFENVEGILSAQPGGIPITERIFKSFKKIGYDITDDLRSNALFDMSYYDIPQKRKRIIILGVQKSSNSKEIIKEFYNIMHSKKTQSPKVVKSVFKGLPKIIPFNSETNKKSHYIEKKSRILNHQPRFHNERDMKIFNLLAEDIKSGKENFTSSRALIKLYKDLTGKDSKFHKYNVIREDKPSNTIPAHLYKDGLRHIHPDPNQSRSITVREAARIQSFDDDFEFIGPVGSQYKMIGNAVPPLFSKIIAQTILSLKLEYGKVSD